MLSDIFIHAETLLRYITGLMMQLRVAELYPSISMRAENYRGRC